MDVLRAGALEPITGNRNAWARDLLTIALQENLEPKVVPAHKIEAFSIALPPSMANKIKKKASDCGESIAIVTAGMIAAAIDFQNEKPAAEEQVDQQGEDEELLKVRPVLHRLTTDAWNAAMQGRIVLGEASTGTGKGRMIAYLASKAVERGLSVVIAAPLSVSWQLMEALHLFPAANNAGVNIALGRSNFVSPSLLRVWAVENSHDGVIEWLDAGAPPISPKFNRAQKQYGVRLAYLLEDALSLAEDAPASAIMLTRTNMDGDCPAEKVFQDLRKNERKAMITICSHQMIASDCLLRNLRAGSDDDNDLGLDAEEYKLFGTPIPDKIGLLLIDEAHQLEQAFATVYTQTLHVNASIRAVEKSSFVGKKTIARCLTEFADQVRMLTYKSANSSNFLQVSGMVDDFSGLEVTARKVLQALDEIKVPKKDAVTRDMVDQCRYTLKAVVKGRNTVRLELTPVRHYAVVSAGRSSLEKPLGDMWARVGGAICVSATLYSDGVNSGLTRWKLGIPKERLEPLPSVRPSWVTEPVVFFPTRVSQAPDDSPEWIGELAEKVVGICSKAKGGTLVLCTSYQTVADLSKQIPDLGESRPLIVQSASMGAAMCAHQFRELYKAGKRPVWIGVGAAWTGVDLSHQEVEAADDHMLTDLVITRLPMGMSKTLMHERREKIMGFGITIQEAAWTFRQGVGRLVRRQGVAQRNLWVLDSRLDGKETWARPFRNILKGYKNHASSEVVNA